MPKKIEDIVSFRAGELSDYLDARSNLKYYKDAAKKVENLIIWSHGGVTKRPGTVMVTSAGEPYYEECIGSAPVLAFEEILDETTCQGEAQYTVTDICQWFKYTVESSVVSGTWVEEIILDEGTTSFIWDYSPYACTEASIRLTRIQERFSLPSNEVVTVQSLCNCSGTLVIPVGHLECGQSTNIYVENPECCIYYLEVETIGGGSAEDGLVQTSNSTWTYTCPVGIGVDGACCIVETATFTLYCCDDYIDEGDITLGTFVPIYWHGSNPDTVEPEGVVALEIIDGKPPYYWTSSNDDFIWAQIVTVTTTNFLTAPLGDEYCGASTSLNVIDACNSNALGSMRLETPCTTQEEVIGYTTKQMSGSQQQTLTVIDPIDGCDYTWEITSGGGELNVSAGIEVIYTAPATNPNCVDNPTITLTVCGVVVDTLSIAVNILGANGPAYGVMAHLGGVFGGWVADGCDCNGTGTPTEGADCAAEREYMCNGSRRTPQENDCYKQFSVNSLGCTPTPPAEAPEPYSMSSQFGGSNQCCRDYWAGISNDDCLLWRSGWWDIGFDTPLDVRPNWMKLGGCCPEQLL